MAEKNQKIPIWEWIIAGVGLILVAGAVGIALYRAITEKLTPPMLSINVEAISPVENGFLVNFKVRNTGNQTAAGLTIEGQLKNGSEAIETSSATLRYAPANSEREGGLFFAHDPRQYQLGIRATGYEEP